MRSSHILLALIALYPTVVKDGFAASRSNSSRSSKRRNVSTSIEKTKQDCITKYIAALDLECYNSNNTNSGGVYSDCADRTITELYEVMDMRLASVVAYKDLTKYVKNCPSFKGEAVSTWLGAKGVIESSAVKSSSECLYSTDRLNAAKKCYSAALAHDGNFFDFENLMQSNCGTFPDIAQKFAKAGDLGLSNIPKMLENYSTLQFTNKSANWRNAVEAIFAGYIYEAREACGEENYDIVQLNNFDPDSRENLLTIANEGFASQFGEQLGSRTENLLSTGSPTVGYNGKKSVIVGTVTSLPTQAIYTDTFAGKTIAQFYKNMGWNDSVIISRNSSSKKTDNSNFGVTSPQLYNVYDVKNIFLIENIPNLNNARARLTNIIKNGDLGTYLTQDTLDQTIANALGARSINDPTIYNTLSDLENGDTFIIKDTNNACLVLMLSNNNVIKLSSTDVNRLKEIYNYVSDCISLE